MLLREGAPDKTENSPWISSPLRGNAGRTMGRANSLLWSVTSEDDNIHSERPHASEPNESISVKSKV